MRSTAFAVFTIYGYMELNITKLFYFHLKVGIMLFSISQLVLYLPI